MVDRKAEQHPNNETDPWVSKFTLIHPLKGTFPFVVDDGLDQNNTLDSLNEVLEVALDGNTKVISTDFEIELTIINPTIAEEPDWNVFDRLSIKSKIEDFPDTTVAGRAKNANWFNWNTGQWLQYFFYNQYQRLQLGESYQEDKNEQVLIRFAKQRLLHPRANLYGKQRALGSLIGMQKLINEGLPPTQSELDMLEEGWQEGEGHAIAFVGSGIGFRSIQARSKHRVPDRKATGEQLAEIHDTAFAIRNQVLEILLTPEIPNLLNYSAFTREHQANVIAILQDSLNYPIVEIDSIREGNLRPSDAIVHHFDGRYQENHLYEFPHSLNSPYINAFDAIAENRQSKRPYLNVGINIETTHLYFDYHFSAYSKADHASPSYLEDDYQEALQGIGEGMGSRQMFLPERRLLLNFIFTPESIDPTWLAKNWFYHERKFLQIGTEIPYRGVNARVGQLDSRGLIAHLQKQDRSLGNDKQGYSFHATDIYGLEKEGDKRFAIVNLGIQRIGEREYHVYTGAEIAS